MKNLEKKIEKLIRESLYASVRGERWTRIQTYKDSMREIWKGSDYTTSELCDAFDINLETLQYMLDEASDRKPKKDLWAENFDRGLSLFVPVNIRGI